MTDCARHRAADGRPPCWPCRVARRRTGAAPSYPTGRPPGGALPPGGGTDNLGRMVGRLLSRLGQPVVIENRGGAGGNIGRPSAPRRRTATRAVDGNGMAIADLLFRNPGYEWKRDFMARPRRQHAGAAGGERDLPARSLAEFIAYAKANRGKLNHGTAGAGTSLHLAAALFNAWRGASPMCPIAAPAPRSPGCSATRCR